MRLRGAEPERCGKPGPLPSPPERSAAERRRRSGEGQARAAKRARIGGGHQDHLGTPSIVASANGTALRSNSFTPYGAPDTPDLEGPGFTGHRHDLESELIDMRGRLYDPLIARFMSPDPIISDAHLSEGLNPYSYVFNSPMNWVDPSGFEGEGASGDAPSVGPGDFQLDTIRGPAEVEFNAPLSEQNFGPSAGAGTATMPPGGGVWTPGSGQTGDVVPSEDTASFESCPAGRCAGPPRTASATLLSEATRQVEGDWEFYDKAGEVVFVVATTVFTGGAAWFGRGAAFGKTGVGATATAARGLPQVAPRVILGICFAKGTPVHTSEGLKPIEEVAVGDLVWAWDEATGELSLRRVVRLFETPDQPLVEVTIAHVDGSEETIRATSEHPFWTGEGWIPANQLEPGDRVWLRSGAWSKVAGLTETDNQETVYNFEVDTLHTYFVGAGGTLVHNQSALTRPLAAADIGLSGGGIAALEGSVFNAGTTRIINVANIKAVSPGALVGELRGALPNILNAARAEGVQTLQISGTFANPGLQQFAASQAARFGGTFSSSGGVETLTFILR